MTESEEDEGLEKEKGITERDETRRTRSCINECSTLRRLCQLSKGSTGHAGHLRRVSERPAKKAKSVRTRKSQVFAIRKAKE